MKARANSAVDLHLDLGLDLAPGASRHGVRAALTGALREAVRTGRLVPGTQLPPSRTLAADLGLSRNTVAEAYADLVAEGWLTARQGSGTRVAELPPARPAPNLQRGGRSPVPARDPAPTHNFYAGSPDVSAFPRAEWLAAARRALTRAPSEAFGAGDRRGRVELRTALAEYLARARGLRTHPDRIVLVSGFGHGLSLLGRVLRDELRAREAAVESYGLWFHREQLSGLGLHTPPLEVDGRGADTTALTDRQSAVLLTAAHQFPLGVPLHPDRRAAAIAWARRTGGLVIEDDYDGEFRYDRQPVGAMQGLAPEHVAYLGTASKSLAPALRLAWMALPEHLVAPVLAAKAEWERHPSSLDQLTLAEFIASGGYDRHLRAQRLRYRRRRDRLVAALAERAPEVRVTGIAAGLHAVLELPPGTGPAALTAASWLRLAVEPLGAFRHPDATAPAPDALVVGYASPADHAFPAALDALCKSLAGTAA
ncbi:PLP-dependent aminotransferase family protein [Streptacidiphilus monticola]|uniref:PLP-dependent aminotransferase family protein n=1 Tax=Streptacidiphilus monticola TaxID=2161674 RepID=A0ABW1FUC7_9ACTN